MRCCDKAVFAMFARAVIDRKLQRPDEPLETKCSIHHRTIDSGE